MKNVEKVLVTGGAGFIGSHVLPALLHRGATVCVFDNLSTGKLENIKHWFTNTDFAFIRGDLLNTSGFTKLSQNRYDLIFHLAANPEVRISSINPDVHFQQNLVSTLNLLEYLRKSESNPLLVFTSTSTVYGEAAEIPTPENYAPLLPISIYGATKLACECLISAYAYTYGFKAIIYRLANIIGRRSQHGVIYDFIQKLKKKINELEILGDGTQTKSYLHISDCIEAMLIGVKKSKKQVEIFNIGSEDQINVINIAKIVIDKMELENVKIELTGGVDGGRGWKGDVKNMLLDISKIKSVGWKPKLNSKQAVQKTAKTYIEHHFKK